MCVWALLSWAGTLFSVSMGTRVEYLIKQKKKRVHYKYRKFFFIKMSKTHMDSFAEFMQSFFIFDSLYVSEFVFLELWCGRSQYVVRPSGLCV